MRQLLFAAALLGVSGCATMLQHKEIEIPISDPPSDLQITVDGKPAKLGDVMVDGQAAPGLALPRHDHKIVLRAGGREVSFRTDGHVGGGWILLDVFLSGPIGIAVDAATGDWTNYPHDPIDAADMIAGGALLAPPPAAVAPPAKDPGCEALVGHIESLLGADDRAPQFGRVFATYCDRDAWPASVKTCIAQAKTGKAVGTCAMPLSDAARSALFHDGEIVMGWQ